MARIAIAIEDVNRRGGQERVVCELLWRLAGRHEVDLICFQAADIPPEVRVLRVPDPGRFSLFLRALWFVPFASRRAARGRYDVVIGQGTNLWNPTHVLAHTCQAWRSQTRREVTWRKHPPSWARRLEYGIRDRLLFALERRMARRSRGRVVAVGDELKASFIRFHGLSEADIAVAHNGVDHGVFNPGLRERWRAEMRGQLRIAEDVFVPLFVGGLWEEKGLFPVIEALARMRYTRTLLVVVGRGDEGEFGRRAEALGVRDRVVFAGSAEHPERYYGMADSFVFLSEIEGLGLVKIEAAASGLPLVLAEGHSPPGLLEEGENGFAVPPTPALVAARLDCLAADPAFRRRAGEASYQRSLAYSWDRQAEKIEAFVLGSTGVGAIRPTGPNREQVGQ